MRRNKKECLPTATTVTLTHAHLIYVNGGTIKRGCITALHLSGRRVIVTYTCVGSFVDVSLRIRVLQFYITTNIYNTTCTPCAKSQKAPLPVSRRHADLLACGLAHGGDARTLLVSPSHTTKHTRRRRYNHHTAVYDPTDACRPIRTDQLKPVGQSIVRIAHNSAA